MLAEAAKAAASTVVQALQKASAATGVDFNYLLGTAMRESGLKPEAKSANSSASGLFQFVEQTWMGLVKEHGAQYGLGSFSNVITKGEDGRYRAKDPNDRSAILRLRNDPQISALMAGEYTKQTQSNMEDKLGRKVTSGELYAGHLFGSAQACRLIKSSQGNPHIQACDLFPQAADANPNIFYHQDGSPKSVREVYNWTIGQVPATPTLKTTGLAEAPSVKHGVLSTDTTAATMAALWGKPRSGFFSSDENSGNAPPLLMSPAIIDVLQAVAKNHGKK
jgi:Transglycosylase SLT domain.